MTHLAAAIGRLTPDQFWAWSRVILFAWLTLIFSVIMLGTWLSTTLLMVLALSFSALIVFFFLARSEIAILCLILVGFISVVRYKQGFQPEEVLYGLVYLSYLGYWFISRFLFYKDDVLRTRVDWAIFLFLVYVTLSLPLTPLQGGDMQYAVSEWLSISMLAFYFPIKEACIRFRDRLAYKPILIALGLVALYIALRNLDAYRQALTSAEHLWQIASGRETMNEQYVLMASLVTLTYLVYARKLSMKIILAGFMLLAVIAILIGQSRVVWVSFVLGAGVIFLFVDWQKRKSLILYGFATGVLVMFGGFILVDNFLIVVAGLTDRLFSLQTATQKDISLINRFVEMEVAWEHIKANPILGYGFGVPFKYYSLVFEATRDTSYVHNAYLGVLYRHGLIGAMLLFSFYFGSIIALFQVVRSKLIARPDKIVVTAALACLVAECLVASMTNPFSTSDTTLMIAAIAGLAAAARSSSLINLNGDALNT